MSKRVVRLAALGLALASIADIAAASGSADQIEQGRYLARAGNCMSCHTTKGGQPFAGGLAFETPFGKLYSTNITPDPETGIGNWTQEQFVAALREGVRPDGEHLYPAFPYTAFSKVSDADAAALFAYLKSLKPVNQAPTDNELSFPFNQRWLLGAWKWMHFEPARYVADAKQSAEWNRGAYLVEGLGHCSACHTPRNFLGAEDADLKYTGGTYKETIDGKLLDWSASNLTSAQQGLQAWSVDELTSYLKKGISLRATVFGGMNDVVANSTAHLSEQDVRAMATYLKSLPAAAQDSGPKPSQETLADGELQYNIHCGTCHLPTGLGAEDTGPPLAGSATVNAPDPASLINITLYGAQVPHAPPSPEWQTRKWQVMEAFGHKLSDEETALLLTYIRNAFGNQAGEVTADQVAKQR